MIHVLAEVVLNTKCVTGNDGDQTLETYLIVFQFNSIIQILSLVALILLIISIVSFLVINKKQKDKLVRLDELIKYIEKKL